jgi:tungstate transport system ATP-binding protein
MSRPPPILPLVLDRLSFVVRGKPLLHEVSLTLEPGRRTVILGPNGAGKSLLLRLAHGLLEPTSGRIVWAAADRIGHRPRHALLFQRTVLLRRSARANVIHALALAGHGYRERRQRADRALSRFGLADLADRPASVLSGGEQQLLALARAAALEPEVLFLDEPTAALDPAATAKIEAVLDALHADRVRIVMTTHDLGQARRLADEIAFMHRGRLIESTPASDFFSRPSSPEARAFIEGVLLW